MALVGTKVKQDDIWLLHLSAKIVINQAKGYNTGFTKEEIEITKKLHRDTMNTNVFETPAHLYEDGMMRTEDGSIRRHPLDKSQEECYAERMKKPDDDGVDYLNGKIDKDIWKKGILVKKKKVIDLQNKFAKVKKPNPEIYLRELPYLFRPSRTTR